MSSRDAVSFVSECLLYLGLTDREATDFITYWMHHWTEGDVNFVFLTESRYGRVAEMKVAPKPEAAIRVFVLFQVLPGSRSRPASSGLRRLAGPSGEQGRFARQTPRGRVGRDENRVRVIETLIYKGE